MKQQPAITYLFTTFPKATESFLQREILAMRARGVELRIHSFWGGGGDFHGIQVEPFNKWRLLTLFWMIPWEGLRHWSVFRQVLHGLFTRRAPSWLNFWENMLGAGFACLYAGRFRRQSPGHLHAAWGGAPATAAWLLWSLDGHRFSAAAHAYDIYEHGGDWWLNEKLEHAAFIHTSTEMGRRSLLARGLPAERVVCIHRGLAQWPAYKTLRAVRSPLRIICIARLVPKKGLHHLLQICAALMKNDISFEARIVGDGELRRSLETQARDLGLFPQLSFMGHLNHARVWEELAWADVLLHTGVIAPNGDRDGLPNVIPEAMSAGVLVVSSPEAATTEAVHHEQTGLIAQPQDSDAWVTALSRLKSDDVLCEKLRAGARAWVTENYDAHKNAARLHALFEAAMLGK